MTRENLVGKGLQRQLTNSDEIRRFLDKIQTRRIDAKSEYIRLDTPFGTVHEAVLQPGVAALRADALRPGFPQSRGVIFARVFPRIPRREQASQSPSARRFSTQHYVSLIP